MTSTKQRTTGQNMVRFVMRQEKLTRRKKRELLAHFYDTMEEKLYEMQAVIQELEKEIDFYEAKEEAEKNRSGIVNIDGELY